MKKVVEVHALDNIIFSEFPILETNRLILRQIINEDSLNIYERFSEEEVTKYYGMFPMQAITQAERIINNFNKGFENSISIRWGIQLKHNNLLIGTCGYHNWNKYASRAEVGYELSKDYWGKGYMREALTSIISYGFHFMNLNRIEALVYPENTDSHSLLMKSGFLKEGILREYAFFRDIHQDLVMYSLLKSDKDK